MYRRYFNIILLLITESLLLISCQSGRLSEVLPPEKPAKSPPLSILLVTIPSVGHITPFLALGEELVQRGHNVTLLSDPTDYVQKQVARYNINLLSTGEDSGNFTASDPSNYSYVQVLLDAFNFQKYALKVVDSRMVTSFNVIVGDTYFFTPLMCLSRKWNVTGVYLSLGLSLSPFSFQAWPLPLYQSCYTDNLTFIQRLVSYVKRIILFCFIEITYFIYGSANNICKKDPFIYSASHNPTIIRTSIGFEFPHAMLPLTHYVGVMLSSSQPQLPQDMVEWLDARDLRTVVYVSMGSQIILSSEQAEMIVNGATQANLSVLWSLRKSNQHILQHMTYDPDKVLISEWAPQVTVLKHPSIHSAILHGGLGGVQEALSCGVPSIVVPFATDHFDNAVRVQHYHYGEMIYLYELTTSLVTQKLKLIESDLYRKSLEKIQKIFKKDGGASRAADLVEFYSDVGYEHLIPSYAKYNWSWIEFYNVDVYAVLLLAVLLPSYILYQVIRRCCSSTASTPKKKVD